MLSWRFVADRDGVYDVSAASLCARNIPIPRITCRLGPVDAHANGFARAEESGC